MDNREDLIKSLAESVGFKSIKADRQESVFDVSTGTLYCNGMIITKSISEEASRFFENLERQYLDGAHENKQLAMFYRCAIEAISLMQTDEVKKYIARAMNRKKDQ